MKKFLYLTSYSINKKVKSKSFIITNIILLLLLLLVTNLDSIISAFGGDFSEDYTINVIDKTTNSFDLFKANYDSARKSIFESKNKVEVVLRTEDESTIKEEIKDNKDLLLVFEEDEEQYIKAELISKEFISSTDYQEIVQAVNMTK